jgi:hypothetical protein
VSSDKRIAGKYSFPFANIMIFLDLIKFSGFCNDPKRKARYVCYSVCVCTRAFIHVLTCIRTQREKEEGREIQGYELWPVVWSSQGT